jgi:bifunctional ADP-heptose synthase (sugar kinase/adenylyltransferase)
MKILVIGESCMDVYQYGKCTRLCPEAPAPVFAPNCKKITNAGMSMNVYNNLLSLGSKAQIVTNLEWEKITKIRFVDSATNYILMRVDSNDDVENICGLSEINFEEYSAVVISDYNKGYLTEKDINYISDNHPVTFLDTKKILGDWCSSVKFIKINENELERTKHRLDPELLDKLIITLGAKGCQHKDKTYPVPLVEMKDAAGAGDTFVAALAFKYVETEDIIESILFANQSATKVVQKKGVSIV